MAHPPIKMQGQQTIYANYHQGAFCSFQVNRWSKTSWLVSSECVTFGWTSTILASAVIDRYKVLCTNSIYEYLKVRGLKPQAVASREFVYIVDSIINLKESHNTSLLADTATIILCALLSTVREVLRHVAWWYRSISELLDLLGKQMWSL